MTVLAKLLTLSAVLSLVTSTIQSQFVQADVLAFPRYKVVVTKDKISNTDNSLSNHVIMTSSYGQPFSCNIPNVQIEEERLEREKQEAAKEETEEERQRIIEKGLDLLDPVGQANCIKFYASTNQYWAYEYCHKQYVRQFHIERSHDGKTEKEHETASFYLGFHPALLQETTEIQTKQYPNKAALLAKKEENQRDQGQAQHHKRQDSAFTELKTLGDQRYLMQKWKDGSICDLTEKPRTVEVQYHCDLHGQDRVTSFVEVSTCNYQIIISTPRLCEEMNLSKKQHVEPHKIECRPIVPEALLEEERQRETERLLIQQSAASDIDESEDEVEKNPSSNEYRGQNEEQEIKEVPAAKDEKEILLGLISDLTDQISQLKLQVDGASMTGGNTDKNRDKHVKTEIMFYTMDEDGNIIQQDPSLLSDKLALQDIIKESLQKDTYVRREEEEQKLSKAKDQHNNRQAYQQRYFE